MGATSATVTTSASARLPLDVLTIIFAQLDMADVFRSMLVCKDWRQAACNDYVMRSLCWQVVSRLRSSRLTDLQQPARPAPDDWGYHSDGHLYPTSRLRGSCEDGDASWEDLLKRELIMKRIKFPPAPEALDFIEACPAGVHGVLKGYKNRPKEVESDIWRARIDPIDNVMVTTGSNGGLTVVDLIDGAILWRDDAVKWFANLELSEGWVVHDRPEAGGNGHEAPHIQIRKFERLLSNHDHPRRGHLVTTSSIRCAFHPEAIRLVWPHLVVGGCGRVAVYDVRDNRIIEQFHLTYDRTNHPVRDLDIDDDHIFVLYGWQRDIYEEEEFEDEEVDAGLLVFARGSKGCVVWNERIGRLECATSWYLDDHELGELRYGGQPVKHNSSLGLANDTTSSVNEEPYRYESTSWCEAVRADHKTRSLVLSGRGRLMVVPAYRQAFAKVAAAYVIDDDDDYSMDEPEIPTVPSIGLGAHYSDDHDARPATQLGVADGVAAYISGAHDLPVWVDIRSLLQAARDKSSTPQVRTLGLGQSALDDFSAIIFRTSSCLQLDDSRLLVVGDFMRDMPHPDRNHMKIPHIAVTMDFGSLLRAELSHAGARLFRQPSSVKLFFPARTSEEEQELAAWREARDAWPYSRLILPNCTQKYWKHWAPHLDSKASSAEQQAAQSFMNDEEGEGKEDRLSPTYNWAGRTAWGEGPHDRNWFDQDFPDDMWGSAPGSEDEEGSMDTGEGGGGNGGGGEGQDQS